MLENVSLVVYTNEKGFDITLLTLPTVLKAFSNVIKKQYVTSNRLPSNFKRLEIEYISANIEFSSSGNHFSKTMLHTLNSLDTPYLLFLCDDYLFNSPVKADVFKNIMKLIVEQNADFFSFASLCYCDSYIKNWRIPPVNLQEYDLLGTLYQISDNFRHLYSVQPCIWKVESLKKILTHNPNLSLWDMDNTSLFNTKGAQRSLNYETNMYRSSVETELDYDFYNLTINCPPLTYNIDNRGENKDYYVFDYGEIIRHGKIIETQTPSKILALKHYDQCEEKVKQLLTRFF